MYIDALYNMQGDGDVYLNEMIDGIGLLRNEEIE